jgi:hypothetical protein
MLPNVDRPPALARRFFDRFEPIHLVTYFAPEARQALDELGYRGFWMGYFATRSAPLGAVPPEVVSAIFYNFSPQRVTKALPAAWQIAGPDAALHARLNSATAALRRYGIRSDDENVGTAAELAAKAAQQASADGRPLFAANHALPWPEEPVAKLWHATTLLREHRGDGHVAVLLSAGISGRECNVLHTAVGGPPREYMARARDYDDDEWTRHEQRLARRGLLNGDGSVTEAGRDLKDRIESATDALALTALNALTDDEVEDLFQAITPIARTVVAAGEIPAVTPIGLRSDELDDTSAHLS